MTIYFFCRWMTLTQAYNSDFGRWFGGDLNTQVTILTKATTDAQLTHSCLEFENNFSVQNQDYSEFPFLVCWMNSQISKFVLGEIPEFCSLSLNSHRILF